MTAAEATLEIVNLKGLHARAAAKFVKIAGAYAGTEATVAKLGQEGAADSATVAGTSILGLMMLGADQGSRLRVAAVGPDADRLVEELSLLVSSRFGEEE